MSIYVLKHVLKVSTIGVFALNYILMTTLTWSRGSDEHYVSVHNEHLNSFFFSLSPTPTFGNGHELHGEWHFQHLQLSAFVFFSYYLSIYKKKLSIVQEFNCHKDLCVLTCERLGVLQARLPFTWVTRASLFPF